MKGQAPVPIWTEQDAAFSVSFFCVSEDGLVPGVGPCSRHHPAYPALASEESVTETFFFFIIVRFPPRDAGEDGNMEMK